MEQGRAIRAVGKVSPERFREEIFAEGEPVVMKGQVAEWPAVAASGSAREMARYVRQFDRGTPVQVIVGRPEIEGRFFYTDAIDGLNFTRKNRTISGSVDRLLAMQDRDDAGALYVESTPIAEYLPGFEVANRLGIAPESAVPRIWIGNRATVQTHFDLKENIACAVAGRRRFSLFPPDQTPNLYPGPFELTLSGPPVSMVRMEQPDFEKYPRFREALRHMRVADLEPGDAVYIPYMWWHRVQALEPFNILVNYWWDEAGTAQGSPFDVLLHALLLIRDMPERQRKAWRILFDNYVFGTYGDPLAHLPEQAHGTLGRHDDRTREQVRRILLQALSRGGPASGT
jgi:hypothetical protein